MSDDRFQLVGKTLKDEFRVDRYVAEGGFGVVYKATQLTVGRDVALKVLKTPEDLNPEARAEYLQRFAEEARTLGKLAHPAIVQVLDFGTAPMGEEGDTAWMALEWIPGDTLEDELKARRKQGGRAPVEAMALLRDVLRAMAHAHDLGFAHRDLKPANVMVVRGKRETTVRLLDFGIAKLMDPDEQAGSGATRTKSAQSACSPRYAAPEQLSGARTGPWSDVHALGLILTEVLTDRAVYPGKTLNAIMVEALNRTRPTPAKFGVDVGAWEPVLARALALRPDDRFPDAGALLDALEAALPGATHPCLSGAAASPVVAPVAHVATAPAPRFDADAAPPPVAHIATAPGPQFAPAVMDATAVLPPAHEVDEAGRTAALGSTSFPPHAPQGPDALGATLHATSPRVSSPSFASPAQQGIGYAPTLAAVASPVANLLHTAPTAPGPAPAVAAAPAQPSRSKAAVLVIAVAAAVTVLGVGAALRLGRPSASQAASLSTSTRAPMPVAPMPVAPMPVPPGPALHPDQAAAPEAPVAVAAPAAPEPAAQAEEEAPRERRGRRGRRERRGRRDRRAYEIE